MYERWAEYKTVLRRVLMPRTGIRHFTRRRPAAPQRPQPLRLKKIRFRANKPQSKSYRTCEGTRIGGVPCSFFIPSVIPARSPPSLNPEPPTLNLLTVTNCKTNPFLTLPSSAPLAFMLCKITKSLTDSPITI